MRSHWRPDVVILSCEHGGNEVPAEYADLFEGARDVLASHRGWDIGALGVARRLAELTSFPLFACTFTRLLVEPNRSPDSGKLFSEYTDPLDESAKAAIKHEYYDRHRNSIECAIGDAIAAGRRVLHVGVHSCTDELDGHVRELEVSLLFDPDRPSERDACDAWNRALSTLEPSWRLPLNEPYQGADDGLTTWLRGRYDERAYAGVEVEVRQGLILEYADQRRVGQSLASALRAALVPLEPPSGTGPPA